MPAEFSVVIPALNEEKYLKSCLKSIVSQNFPRNKYEIIVSDGNSSDKTVSIARKYADKVVVTRKKGIWYGRNFGARFAKGKYLVFIDADTTIEKDYLETIHKQLSGDCVAVSMGFRLSEGGILLHAAEDINNAYHYAITLFGGKTLFGFNMAVDRNVFLKVGGFKNKPLEDLNFAKNCSKQGKVKFIPRKMVSTSARRILLWGLWKTFRYYSELWWFQEKNIRDPRIIKYDRYQNIRD
jgi:glycosyltransferase involved in cell wall biosynthesis